MIIHHKERALKNARLALELDTAKVRDDELLTRLRAFEDAMAGVDINGTPPPTVDTRWTVWTPPWSRVMPKE